MVTHASDDLRPSRHAQHPRRMDGPAGPADHTGSPAACRPTARRHGRGCRALTPPIASPAWKASAACPSPGARGWATRTNPTTLEHDGHILDVLDITVQGLVDGTDPAGPWYWGDIGDRDAAHRGGGGDRLHPLDRPRSGSCRPSGPTRLRQVTWRGWPRSTVGTCTTTTGCCSRSSSRRSAEAWARPVEDRLIDEGIDTDAHAGTPVTAGTPMATATPTTATPAGPSTGTCCTGRRSMATAAQTIRDLVRERATTWLRDLPAFAADDGAIPFMGRSLGYRFATVGPAGAGGHPGSPAGRCRPGARCHRPVDPIPPGPRCHRPGHRLVPGRCLGSATRCLRALHVTGCLRVGGAGPGAVAAARVGRRSGPRPIRGCLAAPRGPSTPRSTSSSAAPVTSSVDDPSTVAPGSPRALMDHPDDIPGHDYRPSYGKWLFHSDFPYTNNAADGRPGPDGTVVLEGPNGGIGHRELVEAGGVGRGLDLDAAGIVGRWQRAIRCPWCRIRVGDAWVRAVGLRPTAAVRAVSAHLAAGRRGCVPDHASATTARAASRRPRMAPAGWPSGRWLAMTRSSSPDPRAAGPTATSSRSTPSSRRWPSPTPSAATRLAGTYRCGPFQGCRPVLGPCRDHVETTRRRDARHPDRQRRAVPALGRAPATQQRRARRLDRDGPRPARRAGRAQR